ncbi:hypothetical protein [Leptolyngbya ohadii]|uniref:hypothetical protein n=1 Tax=Leptolyngbya ohadii TaxID=1962290 RepID=UPI000B59BAE5|nr:hypothetical protein [Leptolyngbya ohadii]
MTHDHNRSLAASRRAQSEIELLELVLAETASYPWNPIAPEAEAYFAVLEQEVIQAGWTEAELTEAGQRLGATIENLWTAAPVAQASRFAGLLQQMTPQMPQQLMDTIVSRARQVIASGDSLADQLVQCVQSCLPAWAEEDLQVLARPYAFAMRSSQDAEVLETSVETLEGKGWEQLSSIEQARVALAAARCAIAEANEAQAE